jgi:hypothetical protein
MLPFTRCTHRCKRYVVRSAGSGCRAHQSPGLSLMGLWELVMHMHRIDEDMGLGGCARPLLTREPAREPLPRFLPLLSASSGAGRRMHAALHSSMTKRSGSCSVGRRPARPLARSRTPIRARPVSSAVSALPSCLHACTRTRLVDHR